MLLKIAFEMPVLLFIKFFASLSAFLIAPHSQKGICCMQSSAMRHKYIQYIGETKQPLCRHMAQHRRLTVWVKTQLPKHSFEDKNVPILDREVGCYDRVGEAIYVQVVRPSLNRRWLTTLPMPHTYKAVFQTFPRDSMISPLTNK